MTTASPSPSALWASPEWYDEIDAWVDDALTEHGVHRSGPLTHIHQRPWSVVLSVASDAGTFFAKQNCPGQNFEARLVDVLSTLVPDHVLAPVAVDADRGFLLTADGGALLSSLGGRDVDTWCQVVAQWAEVQRTVAGDIRRLEAAGVTSTPTLDIPSLVEARAAALHSLLEDDPRRVDDASHTALVATLPSLRRSAERLEAVGMPVTLNHNDLHEHNVFVPGSDGRLRFFDLGDAVLAHPMTVLLVPLNVLCRNLDVAPDDRRVRRVVDAYLEVWSDLVPSDVSRAVVPDALRLGRFCRHESWWRVLPALDEAELAEYGDTAAYWLTCMADPPARKTDR